MSFMRIAPFVLALAAVAGFSQDEAVMVVWTPTEGAKLKYRYTNQHPDFQVVWIDQAVFSRVKDGKVTITHAGGEPEVTKDGKPADINVQIGDSSETLLLSGEPDPTMGQHELEITFLGGFRYPDRAVKKGESWTQAYPASAGRSKSTASSTFVGEEKVGSLECFKFEYEFIVEEGPSAKGTAWLSKSDGTLVKRVTQLKGVDFGAGLEETKQIVERVS